MDSGSSEFVLDARSQVSEKVRCWPFLRQQGRETISVYSTRKLCGQGAVEEAMRVRRTRLPNVQSDVAQAYRSA